MWKWVKGGDESSPTLVDYVYALAFNWLFSKSNLEGLKFVYALSLSLNKIISMCLYKYMYIIHDLNLYVKIKVLYTEI